MSVVQDTGNSSLDATDIREGQNTGKMQSSTYKGKRVVFTIKWSNGHAGRYDGKVSLDGRITGTNYDTTANPAPTQHWHTDEKFSCQ